MIQIENRGKNLIKGIPTIERNTGKGSIIFQDNYLIAIKQNFGMLLYEVKIKPNVQYTAVFFSENGEFHSLGYANKIPVNEIDTSNIDQAPINNMPTTGLRVVNFTPLYPYLYIGGYAGTGTDIGAKLKIMLLKGTYTQQDIEAMGYTPPKQDKIQLNTELFGYAGVFDEYLGDGKVLRRWKKVELPFDLNYNPDTSLNNNNDGYKVTLKTSIAEGKSTDVWDILIDYKGQALNQVGDNVYAGGAENRNEFSIHNPTQELIIIVITLIESGWNTTIIPNTQEVMAFMNGWKATANDGTRYTVWEAIGDSSITSTDINYVSTTKVTDVANYSGDWQPYTFIYQLATPVVEDVTVSGELNLYPGDNHLIVEDFGIVEITGKKRYLEG